MDFNNLIGTGERGSERLNQYNVIEYEILRKRSDDILLSDYIKQDTFAFSRYICSDSNNIETLQYFIQNEIWSKVKLELCNFSHIQECSGFKIYKRKSSKKVGFQYFWSNFLSYTERLYITHLLSFIKDSIFESNISECDIIYHSYFGNPMNNFDKTKKYIFYSGEKYSFPKEQYKISLCHEEDKDNVICYPLFFFLLNASPEQYHLVYDKNDSSLIPQKFCAFVVGNPNCQIRNQFFLFLSQYKKVDSYGNVMNNVGYKLDFSYTDERQLGLLGQHKFVICFENTKTDNYYITEKLMIAKASGSIPIYWGTKKCLELFNRNAFLYLEEESEKGFMNLMKKIQLIDSNDNLYLMMRNTPLISTDIKNRFDKLVKERFDSDISFNYNE